MTTQQGLLRASGVKLGGMALGSVVLGGLAVHAAVALACGGGAPVAPTGTGVDDLPYTQAYQIMVTWSDDLDGPALVSVGANIHNAPDGFGYVVPIPQVIDGDDLQVGSGHLLDAMETFTGPRSVHRGCHDYRPDVELVCPEPSRNGGEGEGEYGGEAGDGVQVETVQVGAYEVSLLTSDGATGLLSWLEDNDFELPAGSEEHIEEYLDQGFMFAAVSVPPGTVVADGSSLPPLDFYLDEGFRTLPLLLAANAAKTTQDVIVTTYAPNLGAVGISNLHEVDIEADCMARRNEVGEAYGAAFEEAHASAGQAVWMLEFFQENTVWDHGGEITSTVSLSPDHTSAIEDVFQYWDNIARVGRIHIRYDPGQLTADPAFYAHAAPIFKAIEYIDFDPQITDFVPVCGEGMVDEGSCPPTVIDDQYCADGSSSSDSNKKGCSAVGWGQSAPWLALPLVVWAAAARRRETTE